MKFTAGAKESLVQSSTYHTVKGTATVPAAAQPTKGYLSLDWRTRHATESAAAQHEAPQRQEVQMDSSLETYIERCRNGDDASVVRTC